MSTKTKPAKSKSATNSLESRLEKAIQLITADKAAEAIPMFEAIAQEASEAGNFGMLRTARNYIAYEKQKKVSQPKADPMQEAVYLLNVKQPEAALEKIDKLLKKDASNANLHYLRALALAKSQQLEPAAASLKRAIEIDPGILNVYHLEPEFKLCRRSSLFAGFEQE